MFQQSTTFESSRSLDLITMGRALVDLYGDQIGVSLEEVASFSRYVGGCPTNVAIGAARLGLRVGMITRVGEDHHGRFIQDSLRREGVDTRYVVVDSQRMTALAFLGIRDRETFPLLYYRRDCADMAISPEDYCTDYIASARALLVTGSHITTQNAAQNILCAMQRARSSGTQIVFDLDYRPVLWGLVDKDEGGSRYVANASVTSAYQPYLADSDLIVGTEEEIHIAGGVADTIQALRAIRERSSATLVVKRGPAGCVVFPDTIPERLEWGIVGDSVSVDVVNVVGAGDGFLAGFLSSWLRDGSWEDCCLRGNAAGALVVSRHGCSVACPTAIELEWFLSNGRKLSAVDRAEPLRYLHRTTRRLARPSPTLIIAADHVEPFGALPRVAGRTLAGLKVLIAETALKLAPHHPHLGVLFDDDEGRDAILRVGSDIAWVGRKIEQSKQVPLRLRGDLPAAVHLAHWPRHHIVKCLVPQEEGLSVSLQHERLRELYEAASLYGMELMLEFVHSDSTEQARLAMDRIRATQAMGVKPDWWKLPAFSDADVWDEIEAAIFHDNPSCRGVLLLGGGRSREDLQAAMIAIGNRPFIQGFAIGRTLLMDVARAWLAGHIDGQQFSADLTIEYESWVQTWYRARSAEK